MSYHFLNPRETVEVAKHYYSLGFRGVDDAKASPIREELLKSNYLVRYRGEPRNVSYELVNQCLVLLDVQETAKPKPKPRRRKSA